MEKEQEKCPVLMPINFINSLDYLFIKSKNEDGNVHVSSARARSETPATNTGVRIRTTLNRKLWALRHVPRPDLPCRVSSNDMPGGNIPYNNGPSADHSAFTNRDSWTNERFGTYPGVVGYNYRRPKQRHLWIIEIMCSCA